MAWSVRLCLVLGALTSVAQAQECPGVGTDKVSRVKFKSYANSQTFALPGDGELNFLNNVATLQDCANHCAVNDLCKASVWNEDTHECRLIKATDGCQDEEPGHHSLWKVGFIDTDDTSGCSPREIDAKCADKADTARREAEKKCDASSNALKAEVARLQAENAALRDAKNKAERDLAEEKNAREEDQKLHNRQCQAKLDEEINKRRQAVKDARDDCERNCRSKQDKDLQRQLDECNSSNKADKAERERIENQCAEDRKRCADGYDKLSQKCVDDLSKANQKAKDCDNKCNDAIRQKDDQLQQCTDDLKKVKDQQKQSEDQCKADKANLQKECENTRNTDKTALEATCQAEKDIINKQCAHDLDSAKKQQKQCENKCQAEKDVINKQCAHDLDAAKNQHKQAEDKCQAEKEVIKNQCAHDIDSAKDKQQQQSENKCQAEKDAIKNKCTQDADTAKEQQQKQSESKCEKEKNAINKQCTQDLDDAKSQQQKEQSKCQKEKEDLDKQCSDKLAKEQKASDDKCESQKDGLRKDCEDRCKATARGKDDICYNPGGFTAWPNTLPPFNVDDTNYVLKPNTHVNPGRFSLRDASSPAACAREHCNDASDCIAIRWDVNTPNKCYVFIDSPYSQFETSRMKTYPNSYMIFKGDKV
ncbi:hypothetical protein NW752_001298 [Fusarium irregulare]|uniref:Apple domain-containing protein n=1 Tax=Fusarium irregulare TaxID=2494466 RepID=A0A9W8PH84_9HYPO|nr:hypothetical protein NW766_010877 [Fusarium irregulare]KAJ4026358.1 hypothetical protein NW752_001298 [Fusarium irregulare]